MPEEHETMSGEAFEREDAASGAPASRTADERPVADESAANGRPAADEPAASEQPVASEQPAADGQSADGQSADERAADGAASGSEAPAASSSEPTPAGSAGESAAAEEDESEIAADYLEELLDIADLDGDIDIEIRQNRTYLSVVAEGDAEEELSLLVGRHGEVLDALQELVRLAVLAATGHRSRLILDVAGHREQREGELKVLAEKALESVRTTGEPYHLKPLGSYERKMVHDIVAEHGMHSASEGEGSRRHIVVSPYQAPVEDRSGADA